MQVIENLLKCVCTSKIIKIKKPEIKWCSFLSYMYVVSRKRDQ